MTLALLAETLASSGHHLSLDLSQLRSLCVKMIALSLKFVDRQSLYARLFPDSSSQDSRDFVDWEKVDPARNTLGDLLVWLPLLELCSWEGVEAHEARLPALSNMRRAVRAAGLDLGGATLVCQLLVLHMLQGVPCLQGLQLMTCRALKKDTGAACALLLASLSESPQTPLAYELAFAFALGDCLRVDTAPLEAHLRAARARREGLCAALKQRTVTAYAGRPRLRERATQSAEQKVRLDSALGTWESFTGFCQLHQFPNALSETVKARLYFLAAQQTWDWRAHVAGVLRHEGAVAEKVRGFPVSRPDLGVLHRVISSLRMDGAPPFPELTEFKNTCFRSFPVSHVQRMNLSDALRLYVCAYQPQHCWRDLWKQQLSLMSPQISKDCESFAARVPFAGGSVVSLLCSGG